jgi:hypothetical protein
MSSYEPIFDADTEASSSSDIPLRVIPSTVPPSPLKSPHRRRQGSLPFESELDSDSEDEDEQLIHRRRASQSQGRPNEKEEEEDHEPIFKDPADDVDSAMAMVRRVRRSPCI